MKLHLFPTPTTLDADRGGVVGGVGAGGYDPVDVGYKPDDSDLLAEKDRAVQELRETVEILELKIKKLEQLVRLKDSKIANLQQKFRDVGH